MCSQVSHSPLKEIEGDWCRNVTGFVSDDVANFFHLSLLAVPEVFARINSVSFLFIIK